MTRPDIRSYQGHLAASCAALLLATAAMIALAATASASGGETGQPSSARQLPVEKQTTLGLYVTAREAYEMWKSSPDKVTVLDVRTPEEYLFVGHTEMAWNIPLAAQSYQWDAVKKQFPMTAVARLRRTGPEDCQAGRHAAGHVPFRRAQRHGGQRARQGWFQECLQHHRWLRGRRGEGPRERLQRPADG